MKTSKKGVTLVELIICCAITVLLAGACTAVLISGQRVWKSGSEAANAQMSADVLQTSLYGKLPSYNAAKVVSSSSPTDVTFLKESTTGTVLYLADDDTLVIRTNGKDMMLDDVKKVTYTFLKAGGNDTARAQFNYTVTLSDGRSFSGGIVVSNLRFKNIVLATGTGLTLDTISDTEAPIDLKTHFLQFDSTAPSTEATSE